MIDFVRWGGGVEFERNEKGRRSQKLHLLRLVPPYRRYALAAGRVVDVTFSPRRQPPLAVWSSSRARSVSNGISSGQMRTFLESQLSTVVFLCATTFSVLGLTTRNQVILCEEVKDVSALVLNLKLFLAQCL